MEFYWIAIAFFIIALIYSSVGFGGGSSYLAILSFCALPFDQIRVTALLCNIAVVCYNVFRYQKVGMIDWRKVIPLVVVSVPMAFLGARIKLSEHHFFIVLGTTLIIAGGTMLVRHGIGFKVKNWGRYSHSSIGGIIGFLSGMVGIGGGIFLSPVLFLTGWDQAKKIAACCSVFIFLNSLAGMFGIFFNTTRTVNWESILILIFVVITGSVSGNLLSLKKFNTTTLRWITALLVIGAGTEVLIKHI